MYLEFYVAGEHKSFTIKIDAETIAERALLHLLYENRDKIMLERDTEQHISNGLTNTLTIKT